ncbi:MAG TPA: TonB-dependent receptor plug domain-containing protein, partial [Pseudomonadales bacterium]|nr:TonB-dependent receptor plug domain-containing protein [Pseudomonadales bacterium]
MSAIGESVLARIGGRWLAILVASLSAPVWAEQAMEAVELETVEVSASKTATPTTVPSLVEAEQAARLTPGGANVVDSESYTTGRASTVQDALGYSPGVFVQPRFGAEESRLSIRGSGIQRTFHMRGIKL